MIVYKYLPAEFGIQAIKNQRLKVAIADRQNDIFDCFPLIQAGELPNEKDDRELTIETIKQMATWYGIVSFSEEPDNLLLSGSLRKQSSGYGFRNRVPSGRGAYQSGLPLR